MRKLSLLLLILWVFLSFFGHFFLSHSAYEISLSHMLLPPSFDHFFGTDEFGRDILSRTIEGGRYILFIAPPATILSLFFGAFFGLVTACSPSFIKEILNRVMDVLLSFPMIIIAFLLLAVTEPNMISMIFVIAFIFTPIITKNIKVAAEIEFSKEYVQAALVRKQPFFRILFVEILPNLKELLIAEGTARLGYTVFLSTTLSFLGVGLRPPTPDWGLMIKENQNLILTAPWTVAFPAICLALIVVSINIFADSFQKEKR